MKRFKREEGIALVWLAITLVLLIGMAGFGLDLGWIYLNTARTQKAVDAIFGEINTMKSSVVKLEEASKARVAAPRKSSEPVVAGPGEYVVKPGDTGMKIARSIGVSIGDLQTVNPTVDWNHLKVGQKLKIPGK